MKINPYYEVFKGTFSAKLVFSESCPFNLDKDNQLLHFRQFKTFVPRITCLTTSLVYIVNKEDFIGHKQGLVKIVRIFLQQNTLSLLEGLDSFYVPHLSISNRMNESADQEKKGKITSESSRKQLCPTNLQDLQLCFLFYARKIITRFINHRDLDYSVFVSLSREFLF